MKKIITITAAFLLGTFASHGALVNADGIYSSRNAQIEVRNGIPGFNTGASFDTSLLQGFQLAARQLRSFGITLEYSVQSIDSDTYRINWTLSTDGSFGPPTTISIAMEVSASVTFIDDTTAELKTTITYFLDDETFLEDDLSFTFNIRFDSVNRTLIVTLDGRSEIFRLGFLGGGDNENDPILPLRPNWASNTRFTFPVFDPADPIWSDPPFAEGFEYAIASKRTEKFTGVRLPTGFGNNLTVSVYKKVGKKFIYEQIPGSFNSGSLVEFDIPEGVTKFRINGIRPTVDLQSERPYPVGLFFTNLSTPNVSFTMKPLKKLKEAIGLF